ncbi:MAG: Aldehyde Dehydrogenase [Acidobacteriales bacterium]|nr:Aldehyde Dehydrogenase [Terriglobales bacterium]
MAEHAFLVHGEWIARGKRVAILSPYDGSVVGETFEATRDDLERAIAGSVQAFVQTRRMPALERQRILREVAGQIAKNKDAFARMIALEAAKPMKAARVEVERAVMTFSLAAEESTRNTDETISLPGNPNRTGQVR